MSQRFDLLVVGAGPGGYVAALRAARRGLSVALIEREKVGGTCLNRGCIPTKTMVQDAEVYHQAASGAFCVESETPLRVNFARLMARKNDVVTQFVGGVEQLLGSAGVELVSGSAKLVAADRVEITDDQGTHQLEAEAIILATGSSPAIAPIPGADLSGVITSRELLEIDHLPQSMVVIGGSTVGVEFACLFNALGTQVTLFGAQEFYPRNRASAGQTLSQLDGSFGHLGNHRPRF